MVNPITVHQTKPTLNDMGLLRQLRRGHGQHRPALPLPEQQRGFRAQLPHQTGVRRPTASTPSSVS